MNIEHYISDVESALHIEENGPISWMGEALPFPDSERWKALTSEDQYTYQYKKLKDTLYSGFYVFGEPRLMDLGARLPGNGGMEDMLRESHQSRGHWETGWAVEQQLEVESIVVREGIRLRVANEEIRTTDNGTQVLMPGGRANLSPGFYAVIGDAGYQSSEEQITTRVYFALVQAGATWLCGQLTAYLNQKEIPFFFKVLSDPASYGRADAAVLYIDKPFFEFVQDFIRSHWAQLSQYLYGRTTAFARVIAPGIGVAEDPEDGQSFGEHRCGLLAEAMLLHQRNRLAGESTTLLDLVKQTFIASGIDAHRPHLPVCSEDVYDELSLVVAEVVPIEAYKAATPSALEMASSIGNFICDHASWEGKQCNWMSRFLGERTRLMARAMNPGVYDGTSGVAWFLADLYDQTGEDRFRETAIGAMNNALDRLGELKNNSSFSFYQGMTGVLNTAAIVGNTCGDAGLLQRVSNAVGALDEALLNDKESDVLGGMAGTLCGLLLLAHQLRETQHLPVLIRLMANELSNRAIWKDDRASWEGVNAEQDHHLCGMSHGASGIALALAEAGGFLKTDDYNTLIRAACNYEESWHEAAGGKWPDLRYLIKGKPLEQVAETSYWCHGAPGISLVRNHIGNLWNDPSMKRQATRDFQVTSRSLTDALYPGNDALSMCHGVCGNASVLLPSGLLDSERQQLVLQLIHKHLLEHLEQRRGIPAFGYFTGLAGVGHYLVTVHAGRITPMLLPVCDLLNDRVPDVQCCTTKEMLTDSV